MRKNFITNIGFLLLLNLLVKPFWILGIDRSVQNAIGAEAYGTYFALFNFAFLFQVVLDFGINNYNNRQIAGKPELLSTSLMSTLVLKVILSVVYTLLVFVVAFGIHFSAEQLKLLGWLVMMQILMSFYAFLRSNVSALHLFKTDAMLSVLDKLLTSIICGPILWTSVIKSPISATLFIYSQIIGYIIAIIVATLVLSAKKLHISFTVKPSLIKDIFRQSYPYALLGFLMTAYYRIDGVLLERMLENGAYEAGVYASAFRLLDALAIAGFLLAGVLMKMFARMLEENKSIQPLLEIGFKVMLIISVCVGVGAIFYRNEIMALLYLSGDAYSGSIFGWLMVSFICISLTYIYGSLLTAGGKIALLNKISLVGFAINLIFNLLLIPKYLALGSAIATVAAQILVLFAHVIASEKSFQLTKSLQQWLKSALFIAMVVGINLLIAQLHINWVYALVISGLVSFLAVFPSTILTVSEVRQFLRTMSGEVSKK